MDVMYAVVMDEGKGPPVGLWRNEETARGVCAKQPPGHKDIVVAVVPASVVDDLTRQLAEARERIAEMEPHSRWYKHREEINRRKNGSPCCCEFDDDDEPITQCAFHADLRRELAEARALLAERKWNPTEHPQ